MGTDQSDDQRTTYEELDDFLAAGSEALRGTRLIPQSKPPSIDMSEFKRGTVLPTHYGERNEEDSAGVAVARILLKLADEGK